LNCTNAIHEISNYIDGELEATVRIQLEEHFRECEGCATIVRQTEVTIRIFSSHQPADMPKDVRSRLHESLKRKLHKSK
jgi:anti-sigma factor RsiW